MRMRFVSVVLMLVLASSLGRVACQAQSSQGEEYFAKTGHWVKGEFLVAYRKAVNPAIVYGNPITDEFTDKTSGYTIQYFEKARFELHPEAPAAQRVQFTLLGKLLYTSGQPGVAIDNSAACRRFAQTGFQVCYAFLQFFDANGGEQQFGYPISNLELQNGRQVQYFQRARLDWRPELPSGKRVAVADLGKIYFDLRGENQALLQSDTTINGTLSLVASAFPQQAVTSRKGQQTVFVIVRDQRLEPIQNARVELTIHLPSGQQIKSDPVITDKFGVARYTFQFDTTQLGVVTINVQVTRDELKAQTVTSFRIWW
jgi:hypothetical protein